MNLTRTRRLLNLIGLLQGGGGHNVDALARDTGVSRRTIFRDLDVLRQAGVPLELDAETQCYRVAGTYYLPPTSFTPEEALAMIILCHELGDRERLPFFSPARSAIHKLESALPLRLREHLQRVTGAVRIEPGPRNPLLGHGPTYQQVIEAIAARRSVRIRYQSLAERQEIRTRLNPYRLLFSRRAWYVIGRSSLHRGVRTFHVGRILRIEPLEDTFHIPNSFSIERYLGNAWHLVPEPGPDQEVVIRFGPLVAQNVAEVQWHRTQRTAFLPDGSLEFRVLVSGLHEISWWILGYGDQAEVLQPEPLRQLIAECAARTLEHYGRQ